MADVQTTARVLNVSTRYVQTLSSMPGCPARLGPGDYDLPKLTIWYLRYLQSELERRGSSYGPETAEIHAARLSLISAQVASIEMENAVVRGDLVEADAVRNRWTQRVVNSRAKLRALPSGLGPALVNKPLPFIMTRLSDAIEQALAELRDDG